MAWTVSVVGFCFLVVGAALDGPKGGKRTIQILKWERQRDKVEKRHGVVVYSRIFYRVSHGRSAGISTLTWTSDKFN